MNRIGIHVIRILIMPFLFLSCNKSDDNDEKIRIQIIDASVENADVYAEDYWKNTELVWGDEFNGTELDENNWFIEQYKGGQINAELQNYVKDGIGVSNGTLKITAKKIGAGQNTGDYTSSRLLSNYEFTYGRIEINAKLPAQKGNGLWAKTWMLASDFKTVGSAAGTIDIMRYVSHMPNEIYSYALSSNNSGQVTVGPISLQTAEEEFHTYGLLWTDRYLRFYIDDIDNITSVYERPQMPNNDNWPFAKLYYFVLNVAVGGEFGGEKGVDDTIFPTAMEIDYVRVYHAK